LLSYDVLKEILMIFIDQAYPLDHPGQYYSTQIVDFGFIAKSESNHRVLAVSTF
jgi:hypothetical protein